MTEETSPVTGSQLFPNESSNGARGLEVDPSPERSLLVSTRSTGGKQRAAESGKSRQRPHYLEDVRPSRHQLLPQQDIVQTPGTIATSCTGESPKGWTSETKTQVRASPAPEDCQNGKMVKRNIIYLNPSLTSP